MGLASAPFCAMAPDVGDMQECRALAADVDERGLHAGQHAHDAPHADVADQAARGRAFDLHFLYDTLLDYRHARFLRRDVNQDFLSQAVPSSKRCRNAIIIPRLQSAAGP